jgi:hypothetical protein
MRIGFLDGVIILLVLLSLFSYFSQYGGYEQKETLEYSGSQIFKAIKDFENYTSKGFLYDVEIHGRLNMDDSSFEKTGLVVETGKGHFTFKEYTGQIYTVGGVMSYKEDLAAEKILMHIETKSTVFYRAVPVDVENFGELHAHITDVSSFMAFKGIHDIAITGEFVVDSPLDGAELEEIIYCNSAFIEEEKLTIDQLSIRELELLDELLQPERIYTGDFWVIIRTDNEIEELEKYAIKREDDANPFIYEDSIHIRL